MLLAMMSAILYLAAPVVVCLIQSIIRIMTIGADVGEGIGNGVGDGVGDSVGNVGNRIGLPLGFRRFQLLWPSSWTALHLTVKELAPIVMACAVWGKRWQGRSIRCICDNAAVVSIINSGSSRDATVMHLMRCLFFFQAVFSLSIHAVHLPGKQYI